MCDGSNNCSLCFQVSFMILMEWLVFVIGEERYVVLSVILHFYMLLYLLKLRLVSTQHQLINVHGLPVQHY